jgi:hypothetical protein
MDAAKNQIMVSVPIVKEVPTTGSAPPPAFAWIPLKMSATPPTPTSLIGLVRPRVAVENRPGYNVAGRVITVKLKYFQSTMAGAALAPNYVFWRRKGFGINEEYRSDWQKAVSPGWSGTGPSNGEYTLQTSFATLMDGIPPSELTPDAYTQNVIQIMAIDPVTNEACGTSFVIDSEDLCKNADPKTACEIADVVLGIQGAPSDPLIYNRYDLDLDNTITMEDVLLAARFRGDCDPSAPAPTQSSCATSSSMEPEIEMLIEMNEESNYQ